MPVLQEQRPREAAHGSEHVDRTADPRSREDRAQATPSAAQSRAERRVPTRAEGTPARRLTASPKPGRHERWLYCFELCQHGFLYFERSSRLVTVPAASTRDRRALEQAHQAVRSEERRVGK